MKFSVTVGAAGAGRDPRGLAELARVVEGAGWDGLFLEDYLVYQGDASLPTYDPWVCLAAIAAATERIRIGTTVTPLPRRHPWKVAAEVVALDQLSGGRMILGVGSGDPGDPFLERREPRVPIWIGGNMLVPAVRRRIRRWGGSCAYKGSTDAPQEITPDDVRELRADGAVEVKVSGGDLNR